MSPSDRIIGSTHQSNVNLPVGSPSEHKEARAKETIAEWKARGAVALETIKQLLTQEELTDSEHKLAESIENEWGNHPLFIKAKNDAYDRRVTKLEGCSCHSNAPCSFCCQF